MNWILTSEEKKSRYEQQHGDLDERSIVRKGNIAYGAGLALLMAGDPEAAVWLRRAAGCWRESWSGGEAWGRGGAGGPPGRPAEGVAAPPGGPCPRGSPKGAAEARPRDGRLAD